MLDIARHDCRHASKRMKNPRTMAVTRCSAPRVLNTVVQTVSLIPALVVMAVRGIRGARGDRRFTHAFRDATVKRGVPAELARDGRLHCVCDVHHRALTCDRYVPVWDAAEDCHEIVRFLQYEPFVAALVGDGEDTWMRIRTFRGEGRPLQTRETTFRAMNSRNVSVARIRMDGMFYDNATRAWYVPCDLVPATATPSEFAELLAE